MIPANNYEILMDFPGWTTYGEIVNICEYIKNSNVTDILDVGIFGGRLTSAICRSFKNIHVTAIDNFQHANIYRNMRNYGFMTCGDRFLDEFHSEEQFKSMHNYDNLTVISTDFFSYHNKHQMVLIEMHPDAGDHTWEMVFDHSLELSTGINGMPEIIGVCSELGPKNGVSGMVTLQQYYKHEIFHNKPVECFSIYKLIEKEN